MERLQKVIANAGITSRRKAEELIKEGRVTVNGVMVTELGTKVTNKDIIKVDGKQIEKEKKVYYLLNKPRGIITSVTDIRVKQITLIPPNLLLLFFISYIA